MDKAKRVQVGQSTTELGHHPLTRVLLHTDLVDEKVEKMCDVLDCDQ